MEELLQFPVDLTREEFLEYYDLTARMVGPLRGHRGRMILTMVLAAFLAAFLGYQWYTFRYLDIPMLAMGVGLILLAVFAGMYAPRHIRKEAERLYEYAVATGYSYYGTITVHPHQIIKEGAEVTITIPLDGTVFFVETASMQVFINRQGRSIVLPARCMTPEAAAAVRAAADRLSAPNRRFVARLQAAGQLPQPPEPLPTYTLWEQTVRYTTEEFTALVKNRITVQFSKRIPLICGLSLMAGMIYGWGEESIVAALIACAVCFGLLTLFQFVLPYRRVAGMNLQEQGTLTVTFTDRAVKMREGEQYAAYPWWAVRHVYDRGDYAEMFFTHSSGALRIPKRCIEDIAAFEAILEQYWKTASK